VGYGCKFGAFYVEWEAEEFSSRQREYVDRARFKLSFAHSVVERLPTPLRSFGGWKRGSGKGSGVL
jgi:hypothetical protein